MKIKRRFDTIEKHQKHWHEELVNLQDNCPHTDVVKTGHSDTGNWSKSDDSYWYEFRCPDCGRFWTEDQ